MYFGSGRTHKCYELFKDSRCTTDKNSGYFSVAACLNIEKMRQHILECLDALSHAKTLLKEELRTSDVLEPSISNDEFEKLQSANDNVFASAIAAILNDDSPYKKQREKIQVFPPNVSLNDNVGWLPLHWALACGSAVTEEDIKIIYAADPMALSTRHLKGYPEHIGYTAISFLLMQKNSNMSLLSFFLKIHPEAFTIPTKDIECSLVNANLPLYPLHIAAKYSESVEVLQQLLQVDTGMTSTFAHDSGGSSECPLGLLCKRDQFPGFWDMMACLLVVDSSAEVIENTISCVVRAKGQNGLMLIEMLLKANPEAANCSHEPLLHEICEYIKGHYCLQALSLLIAINKDAMINAQEDDGMLFPVHYAASCNTVEVLKFVLGMISDEEIELGQDGDSLLHLAVKDYKNEIDIVEAKIEFLVFEYPTYLHMHNNWGLTPLLYYFHNNSIPKMRIVSALIAADDELVMQGGSELDESYLEMDEAFDINNNLSLPLHVIVRSSPFILSPVSEMADIFRLLINLCPEAISVKNACEKYPYDYAVEKELDSYFIRILLRGDPTINPALLYDLNYAERRLAMFISFRAVTRNTKVSIWASLRFENKDLLKRVISYL